jgi:hypothetical protein
MARLWIAAGLALGLISIASPARAGVTTINYAITGGSFNSTLTGVVSVTSGSAVAVVGGVTSLFDLPNIGGPVGFSVNAQNATAGPPLSCGPLPNCNFHFAGSGLVQSINPTFGVVATANVGATAYVLNAFTFLTLNALSGFGFGGGTVGTGFFASGTHGVLGNWSITLAGQEISRSFSAPEPGALALLGPGLVAAGALYARRSRAPVA